MAEVLDTFDFSKGSARYPWDEWLDGQIRRLTGGTDFDTKPSSVVASARKAASARQKDVNTKIDGDDVIIQAVER